MTPEAAVINTVNLFHLSVDTRDWATARFCLADAVRISRDGGSAATEMPADQFLGTIRTNVEAFSATQHLVSGHHVELATASSARCRASYQSSHVSDAGRWTLAGLQELALERAGEAWRITAIALTPAWEEGNKPMGEA